jgi:hypothetical protein
LEYDFAARGWDLLDVWRGRMTLRRLSVLVDGIIEERDRSWTWREMVGGPHLGERAILADIYDATMIGVWQRGGNADKPKPAPYPRPGDDRQASQSNERMHARARAMKDRLNRDRG